MSHVLVADDEPHLRQTIDRALRARGFTTELVETGEGALEAVRGHRPNLALLDVQMPGMGGMETLARLSRDAPGVPVVIMTSAGTIELVREAFKKGARDFLPKPFDVQDLYAAVEANITAREIDSAHGTLMVGESPRFREAMDLVKRFAWPNINVMLIGETGTGKELFARTIHEHSKRAEGPFVPVDCSTLSESLMESELFGHEKGAFTDAKERRIGHFERADKGTLFLDEIGNLSLPVQAKLLRVLQERTMSRVGGKDTIQLDLRVVSATNANLKDAIARGTFRSDLYYRLSGMTIPTPPLRERGDDIRRLAEHFVARYAALYEREVRGISAAATRYLESLPWQGNVRQLENTIKSAVILADQEVRPEHLQEVLKDDPAPPSFPLESPGPPSVVTTPTPGEGLSVEVKFTLELVPGATDLKALAKVGEENAERAVLEAVLKQQRHNRAQLARLLNVDAKTLRDKLRKYGLD
jgi:DNA-binding NtrC family response regulator